MSESKEVQDTMREALKPLVDRILRCANCGFEGLPWEMKIHGIEEHYPQQDKAKR